MTLLRINNRILKKNGIVLTGTSGEPPTPSLPPYTIRLKFTEGATPSFDYGTGVQVSSSPNIWDLTYQNTSWGSLCYFQSDLIEVIDANTTGVTDMEYMFSYCNNLTSVSLFDTSSVTDMYSMFAYCYALTTVPLFNTSNTTSMDRMFYRSAIATVPLFNTSNVTNMGSMFGFCSSLTSVPLFNTSNVTNMGSMFEECSSLTTIPLFDTSKVTGMDIMFQNCYNVQSGALALYQQASSQATPPSSHYNTFTNCGSNTTTGRDELALIPTDWGGNDGELG